MNELISYLTYLVYSIRYYCNSYRDENFEDGLDFNENTNLPIKCQIADYLIEISKINYVFLNYFYYEINIQKYDVEFNNIYKLVEKKLLTTIDIKFLNVLNNSYSFIINIILILIIFQILLQFQKLFINLNYLINLIWQPNYIIQTKFMHN